MCGINPYDTPSPEQADAANALKRSLLYLSIKVAQKSDQLPESIFITGVKLKNTNPVGGGSFADIFYGEYEGRLVAVKKLRAFLQDTEAEREKESRVSPLRMGSNIMFLLLSSIPGFLSRSFDMETPDTSTYT